MATAFIPIAQVPPQRGVHNMPPASPCDPVTREFGDNPNLMYNDPSYADVVLDVATNVEAQHARSIADLEAGTAAQEALQQLGCFACTHCVDCPVRADLALRAETAKMNIAAIEFIQELDGAPEWLKNARRHANERIPTERLLQLATSKVAVSEAESTGELQQILGPVARSRSAGTVTKEGAEELAMIPTVRPGVALPQHDITMRNGITVRVIDAAVPLGNRPIDVEAHAILTNKMLKRMNEKTQNGRPLILEPDDIQDKTIFRSGNVWIIETRCGEKSRLYRLQRLLDDGSIRITLLGHHGDDINSQKKGIEQLLSQLR